MKNKKNKFYFLKLIEKVLVKMKHDNMVVYRITMK